MDARGVWRPVGPRPARTYWMRRAVLLLVLVVIVVGAARARSGGSPQSRQGTASPGPVASPSSSGPAAGHHHKPARCRRGDLSVQATTDATSYPAGVSPRLSVIVRNTSPAPCRFRSDPAARTWSILSGSDQVWSTADCTGPGHRVLSRLGAGKTISYAVVWDRHRSVAGCASAGAEAQPGAYRLYVTVDRVRSAAAIFHLTT
jgi:hypothetical protein